MASPRASIMPSIFVNGGSWYFRGESMVPPGKINGASMSPASWVIGGPMVLLWWVRGGSVASKWCFYVRVDDGSMVLPSCTDGANILRP